MDHVVADVMRATPRAGFLPRGQRRAAVPAMLRLLDVRRGQSVLDVGSGSRWITVLLGHSAVPLIRD